MQEQIIKKIQSENKKLENKLKLKRYTEQNIKVVGNSIYGKKLIY